MLALISIELANEEVLVDLIRLVLAVQVGPGVGRSRGLGRRERTCSSPALMRVLRSNCLTIALEPRNTTFLPGDHKP